MTDSTASDPVRVSTIPDPTIVDPSTVNGQCDPTDQQPPKRASQGEPKFKMDQEMKISDSVEGQGRPITMRNQTKIEYACYLNVD